MDRTALISNCISILLFSAIIDGLGVSNAQLSGSACGRNCNSRTCDCGGDYTCQPLYNPDNGYLEGQCGPGISGQICIVHCNRGYAPDSQQTLTCFSNGQWSSRVPFCRRTSGAMCEAFALINGHVDCIPEGGITVCRAFCDDGYMIVGPSIITCSPSGDWSEQLPSCHRGTPDVTTICSTLVAPEGGRLVGSCVAANAGDTCQLVCISGYRPSDTRVLICQTDGRWSNSLSRCISSGCPPVQIPQGITSGSCNPGIPGQSCTVTCQPGYTLTGTSNLVCQASGEWSTVFPVCTIPQLRTCPVLPAPANGGTSGACNPGSVGQTCTFYCYTGFRLVGQSNLICGNDGQWSNGPPQCIANPACTSLNPPANGGQSGNCRGATPGQSCSFSCQAGYVLNGQSTIYCEQDGRWSSIPPTCTRTPNSGCSSLVAPSNGFMLGTCSPGRVGETCVYGCDDNFVLRGQRTLTCEAGGRWSSNIPRCDRLDPDGGSCSVLTPPTHGDFEECDNRPGGRCIVVCDPGYMRTGSRVRTCLSQGMWSGYAPTCTRRVGVTTTYTYKVVPLWSLMFG